MRKAKNNYNNKNYKYLNENSLDAIENEENIGDINSKNTEILIDKCKNNSRNKFSSNKNQFGAVVVEKRNYQFYVSGAIYTNKIYKDKEMYTHIKLEKNITNKYESQKNKNMNYPKDISNYKEKIEGCKNCGEMYKKKSSFDFKNVGILGDSTDDQLFKIYHGIPFDINNEIMEEEMKKSQNCLINNFKKAYGNRNNFLIESINIKEKNTDKYNLSLEIMAV